MGVGVGVGVGAVVVSRGIPGKRKMSSGEENNDTESNRRSPLNPWKNREDSLYCFETLLK